MKRWIAAAGLSLVSQWALGAWVLDHTASHLHFVTTKNTNYTEVHNFHNLTGQLNDQGQGMLTIDLRSVETHVPDRNEKVTESFFEVVKFPASTVNVQLDGKKIAALAPGQHQEIETTATIKMHGVSKDAKAMLMITKLKDDGLLVSSLQPIVIAVDDFGLSANLETLRNMVSLPSISNRVPVTFQLLFNKHQ